MLIARVVGVHAQRAIGQHGLGASGGDGHARQRLYSAVRLCHGLWAINKRVLDMPQMPVGFDCLYFKVRNGSHQFGIPVHQTFTAINQTLLVQTHKGFDDAL